MPIRTNTMTSVAPTKIQFGEYEIDTTYSSPYPMTRTDVSKLFICEYCLDYMDNSRDFKAHKKSCDWRQPCGKEIYNKDGISVFEVDGGEEEKYSTNLCLHMKLFIDNKRKDFDVEDFLYYVLTVNSAKHKHIAGYFSKEKRPVDPNNNLSCVLILPQYQRQGYGRFLIDFSYLLSRVENVAGTPEKPLSRVGLLTYQSYWKGCVGQHLFNNMGESSISVKSMSEHTGIDPYDIADTLQMLNMVKQRNGKLSIVIKRKALTEQMDALRAKNHMSVDVNCLKWSPPNFSERQKIQQLKQKGQQQMALVEQTQIIKTKDKSEINNKEVNNNEVNNNEVNNNEINNNEIDNKEINNNKISSKEINSKKDKTKVEPGKRKTLRSFTSDEDEGKNEQKLLPPPAKNLRQDRRVSRRLKNLR